MFVCEENVLLFVMHGHECIGACTHVWRPEQSTGWHGFSVPVVSQPLVIYLSLLPSIGVMTFASMPSFICECWIIWIQVHVIADQVLLTHWDMCLSWRLLIVKWHSGTERALIFLPVSLFWLNFWVLSQTGIGFQTGSLLICFSEYCSSKDGRSIYK